ncbi:hypothetical protein DL98DRAFT_553299 [Cadophora sp. DSE1049]|nr:hypothetical protein DL98DRAFT_553299 [Cadophora sp. DSE1049]
MLLVFRFITGFVVSPILTTGGAAILNIYEPRKQVYSIGAIWELINIIYHNPNLRYKPELEAERLITNEMLSMILIRPFIITFTEPIVFLLNLYIALVYALFYLYGEIKLEYRLKPSFIILIIGSSFFFTSAFLLFQAHITKVYAANNLVKSSFRAAFPLFANEIYKRLKVAFNPIPFVLYYYGERIRRKRKMARYDL